MPEKNDDSKAQNIPSGEPGKDKETKLATSPESGNEQTELIELLTLDYIERAERGENPQLMEYVKRYPQFEKELRANITYYWQEGREMLAELEEAEKSPQHQLELEAFLNDSKELAAMQKVVAELAGRFAQAPSTPAPAVSQPAGQTRPQEETMADLYKRSLAKGMKPPELAQKLGISLDILMAFQQRKLLLKGLPRKLVNQMAELLELTPRQILSYLAGPSLAAAHNFNLDKPTVPGQQDFAAYVRQSSALDQTKKTYWTGESESDAFTEKDLETFENL